MLSMNLPNKITIFRIILIPVFVALLFVQFEWHMLASMIVFFLASVTDFFDGYIARKNNLVTDLGKFLDPMADKMLVACALIALAAVMTPIVNPEAPYKICIIVFSMLIVCRELMISGFRTIAADKGVVLAADMFGKFKTVTQMGAIILLLPVEEYYAVNTAAAEGVFYAGFALLAVAGLLTILSAVNYLVRNRSVLKG